MRNINTLFLGKVFYQFPALASTNAYAAELLTKTKPNEGTVISAAHQYAGRGQIGSTWESEAGQNLTFSTIFYPTFLPVQQQFLFNQLIALAVRAIVAELIPATVNVKWPNDIYINEKKVAGILIQNSLSGTLIQNSIVGIGLNVNQQDFSSLAPKATSLRLESGQQFDLEELLARSCEILELYYLKLKNGQRQAIQEEYLEHLYRFQQECWYQRPDGLPFKGKIIGVQESGRLMLEIEGQVETFAIKEIQFI